VAGLSHLLVNSASASHLSGTFSTSAIGADLLDSH